jgi:predicted metal-dependent HD superfamily phosphohydrolase
MTIVEQAEEFVRLLLKDKLSGSFLYHNFNHTQGVVDAIKSITAEAELDEQEKEKLLLAAWFHDTGYVIDYKNHEQLSIDIATEFLQKHNYSDDYIGGVASLINATMYGYMPQTFGEKIIRDADYSHFISKSYLATSELLRKEWEITQDKKFTDLEWAKGNLELFTTYHHYYTDFAIQNWLPKKEKNTLKIKAKIAKMENKIENKDIKKDKKKSDRYEKGIDTMFKTTVTNHIRLSEIADSKANILLSVNAIIISIALSTLIPKLDSPTNLHLIIPTFVMLIFSVICIIFAILSTRPKITSGEFTRQDISDKKVNLLFFGNFYKMPYEEYQWAITELMNDKEYLYTSMTKDLYHLGIVLEQKYRLLRITYNLFMVGIIASVIAFVIAFRTMNV